MISLDVSDRQYVLDLQNPRIDTVSLSDTSVVRLGRRVRRQSASNGGTTDQTSTTPPTSSDPGTDEVHIISVSFTLKWVNTSIYVA